MKKRMKSKKKCNMDGFKIVFRESSGEVSETWLGEPVLDGGPFPVFDVQIIHFMFDMVHPGCEIISISRSPLPLK